MLLCGLLRSLAERRALLGVSSSQLRSFHAGMPKQRLQASREPSGAGVGARQASVLVVLCWAVVHLRCQSCCLLQKRQTIFLFWEMNLDPEFQVILSGRAGWEGCCMAAQMGRQTREQTVFRVGFHCVGYFCSVSSIRVFCHTSGFIGLQKINNQGRSISTILISVSPVGKVVHCAKPNLKCQFKILAL